MGVNDSEFMKNEGSIKELELIFDENDNILEEIKSAMIEHNISKAQVKNFEGNIKNSKINYFITNKLRTADMGGPTKVIRGQGELQINFEHNAMFGKIKIKFQEGNKQFEGVISKADAYEGLIITLEYRIN